MVFESGSAKIRSFCFGRVLADCTMVVFQKISDLSAPVDGTLGKDDRFYREAGLASKLADLLLPVLLDLGYRLVRVKVSGGGGKILQIMAERSNGTMSIEDCEALSRHLSPILDVHDLIADSYRLEVSSPGIDRPLVRLSDFKNWSGHQVKVDLKDPINGQRRFKGRLEGYLEGEVRVEVDLGKSGTNTLGFPLDIMVEEDPFQAFSGATSLRSKGTKQWL